MAIYGEIVLWGDVFCVVFWFVSVFVISYWMILFCWEMCFTNKEGLTFLCVTFLDNFNYTPEN